MGNKNQRQCGQCSKFVKHIGLKKIGNTGIEEPRYVCKVHGEMSWLDTECCADDDDKYY